MMFLIFLTLKLIGIITWSWWWVTAPLWGVPALLLAILGACAGVAALVFLVIGLIKFVRWPFNAAKRRKARKALTKQA